MTVNSLEKSRRSIMPRLSSPGRLASLSLACVVASSSLGLMALPPAAASAATQPSETISASDTATITSGQLRVDVATTFPQVLGYTDTATKARLDGTTARLATITINGTEYS